MFALTTPQKRLSSPLATQQQNGHKFEPARDQRWTPKRRGKRE
jgi:hypothetical protein